ncbi:MAG: DNA mismatch repair protein MutS, partial [Gemmataceae bacterium]
LIRREVTRVVTPGTLTDDDLLDPRACNHLAALVPVHRGNRLLVGLAWVELSTGRFQATDLELHRLADELDRLAPSEILIGEMAAVAEASPILHRLRDSLGNLTISTRPDWTFDESNARSALHDHFKVGTLTGFGFQDEQVCIRAAGGLLLYLKATLRSNLDHLQRLQPRTENNYLFLDEVTRRSLELVRTLRENSRAGSLLDAIDRTVTTMGSRLLSEWLLSPLCLQQAIEQRLEAVAELLAHHSLRNELRSQMREVYDLQRLTARCSTGRANPRDLVAIGKTLALLPPIKQCLADRKAPLLRELAPRLEPCPDLAGLLLTALVDEPPLTPREGGVIRRGYDAVLDDLHAIASGGKEWIARYQAEEARRTG